MSKGDLVLVVVSLWLIALGIGLVLWGSRRTDEVAVSGEAEWPMWDTLSPDLYETTYDGVAYQAKITESGHGYTAILSRRSHGAWHAIDIESFADRRSAKLRMGDWDTTLPSVIDKELGIDWHH